MDQIQMDAIKSELEAAQARVVLLWTRALNKLADDLEKATTTEQQPETPVTDGQFHEQTIEDKPQYKEGDILECAACGKGKVLSIENNEGYFRYVLEGIGKHYEESLTRVETPQRPEPKFKDDQWVQTLYTGYKARIEDDAEWNEDLGVYTYDIRFLDESIGNREESMLKASNPPAPRFHVGQRVEYRAYGTSDFKPVTIIKVALDDDNDIEYTIRTDNGAEHDAIYDYDWGTDHNGRLRAIPEED